VGFPLLVKAVSGGGGKGMKLATKRVRTTPAGTLNPVHYPLCIRHPFGMHVD
jgi:hypothetical protein